MMLLRMLLKIYENYSGWQAEREANCAALQTIMRPIKRKKDGEEKRISQEEMLLEAAQTEIINLRNLERVLAREEEVEKRAIVHKAVYSGPQLRCFLKTVAYIWNSEEDYHFSQFVTKVIYSCLLGLKILGKSDLSALVQSNQGLRSFTFTFTLEN